MNTVDLAKNPKFTVRYTLGLFLLSNWLYTTLITGPDGIADFSTISDQVFNDKVFYAGAYKQISSLVADINDTRIIQEMMESKTFLLDRRKLKDMFSLDETKMKALAEQGVAVYDMLVAKKLAEQTIFDEEIVPTEYTTIDGSDQKALDVTIPLSLVFSVESDLLDKMSNLLDMNNTNVVADTISELMLDEKMSCFKTTFDFLSLIDSKA